VNVSILLVRPHRSHRDNMLEAALLLLLCLQTSLIPLYTQQTVNNTIAAVVTAVVIAPALLLQVTVWLAQKPSVRAAAVASAAWIRQRGSQPWLRLPLCL
jgi:hypothetical protein